MCIGVSVLVSIVVERLWVFFQVVCNFLFVELDVVVFDFGLEFVEGFFIVVFVYIGIVVVILVVYVVDQIFVVDVVVVENSVLV